MNSPSARSLRLPCATVFLASFCIMVLELTAARLVARHLGSSLYTWTSVIGVVLSGITLGNWIGGRLADRYPARSILGVLFTSASVACVLTVVLNAWVGEWVWLWHLSWPTRVLLHIVFVFLIPSTLLGNIGPVVAKMALDTGLPTGRTVGDIYAWGAVGSIAGTFATGYFLISWLGSIAIVWAVAGVLLLLGLFFSASHLSARVWAAVFFAAATLAWAPWPWAWELGNAMSLRQDAEPGVLYAKDTPYCYVSVKRTSAEPEILSFYQDRLLHSSLVTGEILDLQYNYEQIYAAITERYRQRYNQHHSRERESLSTLFIGGGGYVFPRYILEIAPESRVDVVEIDPGVTEAAMAGFGLPRDTPINIFTLDARNYVESLLAERPLKSENLRYDLIYEDAFNDYSVPYQLTTKEFNNKIAEILTEDGLYLANLIDISSTGLFLGSYLHTLEQTFPHVQVVQPVDRASSRRTFVVVASRQPIDLEDLHLEAPARHLRLTLLTEEEKEELRRRSGYRTLTDDWAPVDNMLAPVARHSAQDQLAERVENSARELLAAEDYEKSIRQYRRLIAIDPVRWTLEASHKIAFMQAAQGRVEDSVTTYREALDFHRATGLPQEDLHLVHLSLGGALQQLGRAEEAREHLEQSLPGLERAVQEQPESIVALELLGTTYAATNRWEDAGKTFARAVNLDPTKIANHLKMSQSLEMLGRVDDAIAVVDQAINFLERYGAQAEAEELRRYLQTIEARQRSKSR